LGGVLRFFGYIDELSVEERVLLRGEIVELALAEEFSEVARVVAGQSEVEETLS